MVDHSNFRSLTLWIVALLLGSLFLLRGAWVGIEGLMGNIKLDAQDYKGVVLFILAGGGLVFFAIREAPWAKSKDSLPPPKP